MKKGKTETTEGRQQGTYLPLARKYRPQTFAELIGQPHVTETLSRALIAKRIAQAYLFSGQRGVGKTSAARILAKSLNCIKGPTPQPCQACPSCLAILQGTSLDVLEIDGASNRGIDDIRQLREQVKLAPVHGQFRVYIIDEVHQITSDAFNALLKTLEEPPAHVKFIFATTAPQKVPATIVSRCQRFDFRRLDVKTVVTALRQIAKTEAIAIEDEALYAIARACEGSLRDAEVILEQLVSFCDGPIREPDVTQLLGALEQDTLLAWTRAIVDRDVKAALALLTQQLDEGKEVTQLLIGLVWHLRNLLILRSTAQAPTRTEVIRQLVDVSSDQVARLDAQAGQMSPEDLLMMVQVLTGAYELARRSPFAQAILEFALIKLATRDSWASLEEVVARLERLAQGPSLRLSSPMAPSAVPLASSKGPAVPLPPPAALASAPPPAVADAPQAAVTPSVVVSLEDVTAHWPMVLERIAKHKISLAAYLADARPLGVSGGCVQVGLPGFALHQEVLNLVEHLRVVEQALGEAIGQPIRVEYTTLPEPPPGEVGAAASSAGQVASADAPAAGGGSAPPIVHDIVKLFNATIMPQPPATRSP